MLEQVLGQKQKNKPFFNSYITICFCILKLSKKVALQFPQRLNEV